MSKLDPSKEAHKSTKKYIKKQLKLLLKEEPNIDTTKRQETLKRIDAEFAHARCESAKYFGEIIEMDACNEKGIDGVKYHVYSAVDNATGTLLATHMEKQETLRGYLILLHKILVQWGIPANIYTDRRNVFDLKRKKIPLIEKDLHTQFGYICKQLGIFLECSSEPTFKPKVERSFRTTQSQLIPEMRRANIHTLDEANLYIEHTYQVRFNNKYSSYTNNTKSVFSHVENINDLNHILSIKTLKTIDNGHCVRHKNKYYLPMEKNKSVYYKNGTKALLLECFDGSLAISVGNTMFSAFEIESNALFSIEFDVDYDRVKRKGGHTPPMSHPYKRASFEKYISKVAHLNKQEKDNMLQSM